MKILAVECSAGPASAAIVENGRILCQSSVNVKITHSQPLMPMVKGLLDNGIHPPTMYFPLIVEEALMVEPTETESKETLDEAVEVLRKLYEIAETDAEQLHQAPVTTPVTRMDEVGAARHPYLRYEWQD